MPSASCTGPTEPRRTRLGWPAASRLGNPGGGPGAPTKMAPYCGMDGPLHGPPQLRTDNAPNPLLDPTAARFPSNQRRRDLVVLLLLVHVLVFPFARRLRITSNKSYCLAS